MAPQFPHLQLYWGRIGAGGFGILVSWLLCCLLGVLLYKRSLGGFLKSFGAMTIAFLLGLAHFGLFYLFISRHRFSIHGINEQAVIPISALFFLFLFVPFIFKLHLNASAGKKEEEGEEKKISAPALKLNFLTITWIIGIIVSGYVAYVYEASFIRGIFPPALRRVLNIVIILVIVRVIIQIIMDLLASQEEKQIHSETEESTARISVEKPASSEDHELSSESMKILEMIQEGKISSEEGAELLSAIAESRPERKRQSVPLTRSRKFILVGAILVFFGFLLPWAKINIGEEVNDFMRQSWMSRNFNMHQNMPNIKMNQNFTQIIHAGNLPWATGWIVLIAALGVAVITLFRTGLDYITQRNISLIATAVGTLIMLYIFTSTWEYITWGFAFAAAGYFFLIFGVLKEYNFSLKNIR